MNNPLTNSLLRITDLCKQSTSRVRKRFQRNVNNADQSAVVVKTKLFFSHKGKKKERNIVILKKILKRKQKSVADHMNKYSALLNEPRY